ncbi:MAG TPA: Na+/H+ antiporter subunit C [Candidatus Competibacteraceae bacterium]|nr:Na+/H+ antiporter subunit C [Candidatus Competibacteraceae bacterium]
MELLVSIAIGTLTAAGVYLLLRLRTFPVVLGLTLLSYAVNTFIFAAGRLMTGAPPVLGAAPVMTDPLPQALVLTAIVIGFALLCFALALGARLRAQGASDDSDRLRDAEPPAGDPIKPPVLD